MDKVKKALIKMVVNFLVNDNLTGKFTLSGKELKVKNCKIDRYIYDFFQAIKECKSIDSTNLFVQNDAYMDKSIAEVLEIYNQTEQFLISEWSFDTNLLGSNFFQIYQNEICFIKGQQRAIKYKFQWQFPEDFYLIDEKYHYIENKDLLPEKIQSALNVQKFFNILEKVADFVDSRNGTTLYFKTSEKNGHLCSLFVSGEEFFVEDNGLKLSDSIFNLLDEISELDVKSSVSGKEKRFVFSSSIAEFLSKIDESERFQYLIENWVEFDKNFDNNLKIYTDGKSINELKIALAEEQIKLSDNVTKGIIDILSKILILPSISVVFLVFRQSLLSTDYSFLTTFAFIILLLIITLSVCLTANIHLNIIKSLEYSSKFLNQEAKKDFELDTELKNLSGHLSDIISKTKRLLNGSFWSAIILFVMSSIFLFSVYFSNDSIPVLDTPITYEISKSIIPHDFSCRYFISDLVDKTL